MSKRYFSVVAKSLLVRENKFAKAHKSMKASDDESCEKELVMGRLRHHAVKDEKKISVG